MFVQALQVILADTIGRAGQSEMGITNSMAGISLALAKAKAECWMYFFMGD